MIFRPRDWRGRFGGENFFPPGFGGEITPPTPPIGGEIITLVSRDRHKTQCPKTHESGFEGGWWFSTTGKWNIRNPPSESMWFCSKSSEGSREPFLMCPGALESRWFDLLLTKKLFSKLFFRDIFFTWRFLHPSLKNDRKVDQKIEKSAQIVFFVSGS